MKKRVFTIIKEDIIYYPPALSLIYSLLDLGYMPIHIGVYSDEKQKSALERRGVVFEETIKYEAKDSSIKKLYKQLKFKQQVLKILHSYNVTGEDCVWILNSETICLLDSLVDRYPTVVQFYEYTSQHFNWKYFMLNPFYSMSKTLKKAKCVVHCEYNRAHITKGVCSLDYLPFVLPNKPYIDDETLKDMPSEIISRIDAYKKITDGKKVILYQGIFDSKERRLDEFCRAACALPNDYILVVMGKGSADYDLLKAKYSSTGRVLFIPFMPPPYHLMITKTAYIGVLSYFPVSSKYADVINPIYCAPNKIFEYALYSKPMISNDIPGLRFIFDKYTCGSCVDYPMTAEKIISTVHDIESKYTLYSDGATKYYDSVDLKQIINTILNHEK